MATYRISELIKHLASIMNDGFEYVQISELEADEDLPICLSFEAIESSCCGIGYEEVNSVEVPENYDSSSSVLYHVDVNFTL